MNRILVLVLAIASCFGCVSSQKYLEKGQYDRAIQRSVERLIKNPSDDKEIAVLRQAYLVANRIDQDRVQFLTVSNDADIWEEIYIRYSNLKNRQDVVLRLGPAVFHSLNVTTEDYDSRLIDARDKAVEFLYSEAIYLLENGDYLDAREAHSLLLKSKRYVDGYRDVNDKLAHAREAGTIDVVVYVANDTALPLSPEEEAELAYIDTASLDSKWVKFSSESSNAANCEFAVSILIEEIQLSPERIREHRFVEVTEIEDGWQYALDAAGNVRKDQAGNDIKVPILKRLECELTEEHLTKDAVVVARVEMTDKITGELVDSSSITGESIFEATNISASGDRRALSVELQRQLDQHTHFPSDAELIIAATDTIKAKAVQLIKRDSAWMR